MVCLIIVLFVNTNRLQQYNFCQLPVKSNWRIYKFIILASFMRRYIIGIYSNYPKLAFPQNTNLFAEDPGGYFVVVGELSRLDESTFRTLPTSSRNLSSSPCAQACLEAMFSSKRNQCDRSAPEAIPYGYCLCWIFEIYGTDNIDSCTKSFTSLTLPALSHLYYICIQFFMLNV